MRLSGDAVVEVTHDDVTIHMPGAVDITDGRVVWVGGLGEAPTHEGEHKAIGGLLMPGLINAHAHTPMTLLRSVGDGLDLHRWLVEAIWPLEANLTDEDVYWAMLMGSVEMLLAGVTTSQEMYLHDASIIKAVTDTGARLVSTPGVVAALHGADIEGRIAEISDLHARFHDPDNRVAVGFGPHSPYDLATPHVTFLSQEAQRLDTVLHIHLEETEAERNQILDKHQISATKMLAESGVLEARVVAAHGVWLDGDDMKLLAQASTSVAHCPQSNLKLGSGFADITAMTDLGINVCLGTDGPASNDNLDLWDELTLAPSLARGLRRSPAAVSAADALLMACANGGRAVGQNDIGTLTVGSRADVVRVNLDHPSWAPGLDAESLLGHLVFGGSGHDVSDVWVGGSQVISNRVPVMVDLVEAVSQVKTRARRLRNSL